MTKRRRRRSTVVFKGKRWRTRNGRFASKKQIKSEFKKRAKRRKKTIRKPALFRRSLIQVRFTISEDFEGFHDYPEEKQKQLFKLNFWICDTKAYTEQQLRGKMRQIPHFGRIGAGIGKGSLLYVVHYSLQKVPRNHSECQAVGKFQWWLKDWKNKIYQGVI